MPSRLGIKPSRVTINANSAGLTKKNQVLKLAFDDSHTRVLLSTQILTRFEPRSKGREERGFLSSEAILAEGWSNRMNGQRSQEKGISIYRSSSKLTFLCPLNFRRSASKLSIARGSHGK
jgi:hypothetical protein